MAQTSHFLESIASGTRNLLLSAPWETWVAESTWPRQLAKFVWLRWSQKVLPSDRAKDLNLFLSMTDKEFDLALDSLIQTKGADLPIEKRKQMQRLLLSSQDLARNAFRRNEDIRGKTTPEWFVPTSPEDLFELVPHGIPIHCPGELVLKGKLLLSKLLEQNSWSESWKAYIPSSSPVGPDQKNIPKRTVNFRLFPNSQGVEAMAKHRQTLLDWRESINHSGIAPILKANHENDAAWIIHGYKKGIGLWDLVREIHRHPSAQSFKRAARWIKRFAILIGECHSANAVHAAINPKSFHIIKDTERNVTTAALVDLGVGRIAWETILSEGKRVRISSLPPGHPWYYASPQYRKGFVPGPTDDVHALGILWYHILQGDFQAPPPGNLGWADPLLERGFSPSHAKVLSRAISPMSERRQSTAKELAAEIDELAK